MIINFHGFGASRLLSGYSIEVPDLSSVAAIKEALITSIAAEEKYSTLIDTIATTAFASEEHVFDNDEIIAKDMTINLLPPVCGG